MQWSRELPSLILHRLMLWTFLFLHRSLGLRVKVLMQLMVVIGWSEASRMKILEHLLLVMLVALVVVVRLLLLVPPVHQDHCSLRHQDDIRPPSCYELEMF